MMGVMGGNRTFYPLRLLTPAIEVLMRKLG